MQDLLHRGVIYPMKVNGPLPLFWLEKKATNTRWKWNVLRLTGWRLRTRTSWATSEICPTPCMGANGLLILIRFRCIIVSLKLLEIGMKSQLPIFHTRVPERIVWVYSDVFWSHQCPSCFSSLDTSNFWGVRQQYCLLYVDNSFVYLQTFENHLTHVEETLKRLDKLGLRIHPERCFGKELCSVLATKGTLHRCCARRKNFKQFWDTQFPITANRLGGGWVFSVVFESLFQTNQNSWRFEQFIKKERSLVMEQGASMGFWRT